MLARRKEAETVARPSLADRIAQFRAELSDLVDDRVRAIKKGQPGLPEVSIRQMLIGNSNCMCISALKVLGDIERDEKIARQNGG
jgi:hypothetical protein